MSVLPIPTMDSETCGMWLDWLCNECQGVEYVGETIEFRCTKLPPEQTLLWLYETVRDMNRTNRHLGHKAVAPCFILAEAETV